MKHLKYIPGKVDVQPLLNQLAAAPYLWDEFDFRTEHPQSPHRDMSDIIVRYNARENYTGNRVEFNKPHESVWYSCIRDIPAAIPIALKVMSLVEGERLGMVLITRLPAGKQCHPHQDGGWHATYYDKYAVQIASAPGQAFYFEGEGLDARPGEIYWFDNSHVHWVRNPTDVDRITMIVCVRNRFTGVN